MTIKEVMFYQAQCDACGALDDDGDFSAWSEPDHARMTACESGWVEIEVKVPATASGHAIYMVRREGQPAFKERSILLCPDHGGDGINWCAICEDDLDLTNWHITDRGHEISQTCQNRHLNKISLTPESHESAQIVRRLGTPESPRSRLFS